MNLIVASLCAPLVACSPASPNVLHAVTMEGVVKGWPNPPDTGKSSFVSACGVDGVLFCGTPEFVPEWPPRVSSLPPTIVRCRDCHRLTGRKSPRSSFKAKANA